MAPALRVLTDTVAGDPVLDTALGSALLAEVAEGAPPAFRLVSPAAMVSFGRLDRLADGFGAAVAAARRHGFAATMRLGGGRAAALTEDAVDFGLAEPAHGTTTERFAAMTELVRAAARAPRRARRRRRAAGRVLRRRLEPALPAASSSRASRSASCAARRGPRAS